MRRHIQGQGFGNKIYSSELFLDICTRVVLKTAEELFVPSVLITYSTVSLSLLLLLPACSDKVYMKLCHFRTTRCTQCPHMPSYQKQRFIKVFGLNLTFLFQIVCPYSSCGSPVSLKLDHHKSKCKVWVGTDWIRIIGIHSFLGPSECHRDATFPFKKGIPFFFSQNQKISSFFFFWNFWYFLNKNCNHLWDDL